MYKVDSGSLRKNIAKFKLLWNSVISDTKNNAKLMILDLKDIFLTTLMDKYKNVKINMELLTKDIEEKYKLK